MTIIANTIKPTILLSSPSNQFTARLPSTFVPIRTKPLSSSSKPLSVTLKCSNNMNLPYDSSDVESDQKRNAALPEEVDRMWQLVVNKLKVLYEVLVWLIKQDDAVREKMKPYLKNLREEIQGCLVQASASTVEEVHAYLSATVPAAERELAKQEKEFAEGSFSSEEDVLRWMLGIEERLESTEAASVMDFIKKVLG